MCASELWHLKYVDMKVNKKKPFLLHSMQNQFEYVFISKGGEKQTVQICIYVIIPFTLLKFLAFSAKPSLPRHYHFMAVHA